MFAVIGAILKVLLYAVGSALAGGIITGLYRVLNPLPFDHLSSITLITAQGSQPGLALGLGLGALTGAGAVFGDLREKPRAAFVLAGTLAGWLSACGWILFFSDALTISPIGPAIGAVMGALVGSSIRHRQKNPAAGAAVSAANMRSGGNGKQP